MMLFLTYLPTSFTLTLISSTDNSTSSTMGCTARPPVVVPVICLIETRPVQHGAVGDLEKILDTFEIFINKFAF